MRMCKYKPWRYDVLRIMLVTLTHLQLIRKRRIYSRTSVHLAPKLFLLLPIVSTSSKHVRLNKHLVRPLSGCGMCANVERTTASSCHITTTRKMGFQTLKAGFQTLKAWILLVFPKTTTRRIHIQGHTVSNVKILWPADVSMQRFGPSGRLVPGLLLNMTIVDRPASCPGESGHRHA